MDFRRTSRCGAVLLVAWALAAHTARAGDDTLAQAKELYATAAYDEALVVLDRLLPGAPGPDATTAAEYKAFCLLALDRRDEARKTIAAILTQNPLYTPSADQASPRIQSVFRETRRQLLPAIVIERYASAKAAFERKDPRAGERFDEVLALIEDPDARDVAALRDLRTVVVAFRDVTKAIAAAQLPPLAAVAEAPPSPVVSPAVQGSTPAQARDTKTVYTSEDRDVVPAVVLAQRIPKWSPAPRDRVQEFKGTLELLVDERGVVTSATLRASVHPVYDAELLKAVRTWKFAPAHKQDSPVPYLKLIDIRLLPPQASNR